VPFLKTENEEKEDYLVIQYAIHHNGIPPRIVRPRIVPPAQAAYKF
jgi:hypothetical protein